MSENLHPKTVLVVWHDDKDTLWQALDTLNEAGVESPSIAGIDAAGRAFLACLNEEGGDATWPLVLFDEPHEPSYGLDQDRPCAECGCPRRRWPLDDLTYPVAAFARIALVGDRR